MRAEYGATPSRGTPPFLPRRPRHEAGSPFITASFAVLKSLLLPPQYPLASFIILWRRSRLRVPFFDLGIGQDLLTTDCYLPEYGRSCFTRLVSTGLRAGG